MIQTIKLAKLRLSPINVRTAPDEQLQIEPMAASIEAKGVLQNLLVTPAKKPRGTFEVFDGGRRWRALRLLAERGTISEADFDVPVMILTGDDAELSETSTATNFHQLKMTPAEECRAFQHFIGSTGDLDAVAKRFGVTRRFVGGRLRLASLAAPIFDALSKSEITLDIAKAYASTESHDKQLLVWNSYQNGHVTADTIRRVIANETLKASDPIAILVGEERYRAAGGKVDGDLFTDGNDRWNNPEIAHRLAGDIMEAEARRIGEETGLAWIRPIASNYAHNAAHGLYRAILQPPALTEEQSARLGEIEARRAELEAEMQDESISPDAYKALDQEDDRLIAEAEAIEHRAPVLPDELRPHVGAFLLLTPQGEMRLDTQFYSEQELIVEEPDAIDDAGGGNPGEPDEGGAGRFRGGVKDSPEPARRPEAVAPGGKPLSNRLYDELAIQRRDILASCLLAQPALALDPIPDGPPSGPLNLHIPPHKSAPKSPNTTVIEREGKTGLPSLRLVALLTGDGQQIDEGLVWRIFQSTGPTGKAKLVLESHEATPLVKLQPGDYTVNAAFGRANLTRKIAVKTGGPPYEAFVLNAGGLRLGATVAGAPAAPGAVTYSIYADDHDQFDTAPSSSAAPSPISSSGSIPASTASSPSTATPTRRSKPT